MLLHYLDMALRHCRRSMALTVLVVLLIGSGVAVCMVSWAVFRATAADPIPWKSAQLFVPQIDSFGPVHNDKGQPPVLLDYTDAVALLHARQASRQVLIYPLRWTVLPDDAQRAPFAQEGDAVSGDFFAMFDAPFRYGGGWPAIDDDQRAAVVVISSGLNQKLFGGANSVGRQMTLDAHAYRIVGVLGDWNPRPRFFDVSSAWYPFGHPRQIYIPFSRAIAQQQATSGNFYCSTDTSNPDVANWDGVLHSACAWIDAWVELRSPAAAARYHRYLTNFAAEQQRIGRFGWPPNVRLRTLRQWLALPVNHGVPQASALSMLFSRSASCLVAWSTRLA